MLAYPRSPACVRSLRLLRACRVGGAPVAIPIRLHHLAFGANQRLRSTPQNRCLRYVFCGYRAEVPTAVPSKTSPTRHNPLRFSVIAALSQPVHRR